MAKDLFEILVCYKVMISKSKGSIKIISVIKVNDFVSSVCVVYLEKFPSKILSYFFDNKSKSFYG